MKPISEYLKENYLICDGAFGTYYAEKYNTKELPELANLSAPERVREIHEEYVSAGAKLIRSAFHNEIPDTTKIIIAQRVASVQESDMILVMDSGRIMASGTHDELLATCDEYRSIYESQTKNQAQPEELAAAEQAAESSTAEPSETVTVTVTMPTADTSAADANAADTKEGEAR